MKRLPIHFAANYSDDSCHAGAEQQQAYINAVPQNREIIGRATLTHEPKRTVKQLAASAKGRDRLQNNGVQTPVCRVLPYAKVSVFPQTFWLKRPSLPTGPSWRSSSRCKDTEDWQCRGRGSSSC